MLHNVESVTQTVLIVGSNTSLVDGLQNGFAQTGWFVLTEYSIERALHLLGHLSVSAICLFDDENLDTQSSVQALKRHTQGMLFILSDQMNPDERLELYQSGVNHVFAKQVHAVEVKTVITTLQQQQLIQSTPFTSQPKQEHKNWHFCSQSRVLSVDDSVISLLSYNEAKVLKMLIDNCNETLSRERLMMALGRFKPNPADRTLDRLICNLRKKFKKICPNTQFILSLYGHGYVFTGHVSSQVA